LNPLERPRSFQGIQRRPPKVQPRFELDGRVHLDRHQSLRLREWNLVNGQGVGLGVGQAIAKAGKLLEATAFA